jgi:hypothetical protein
MDTLLTLIMLLVAATAVFVAYVVIPRAPVVFLATGAAIALAGGVWWHWMQFSVDYRTSTWQEQLRNYASYVMVGVVILLSYAFYVFTARGGSVRQVIVDTQERVMSASRRVSSARNAASNSLFESAADSVNAGVNFFKRNLTPAALVPTPAEAGILE